jgi:hypothetical protein
MSEWTICITAMPTEEALDIAARIADAEEPDCEDLLLAEGARVCDVLRCEVLHQAEVIERRTAELSTATGEIDRLRAALAKAHAIVEGRAVAPTGEEIAVHSGTWLISYPMNSPTGEADRWTHHISPATLPPEHDGEEDEYGAPMRAGDTVEMTDFDVYRSVADDARWWPLDSHGRPCAWPIVEVSSG